MRRINSFMDLQYVIEFTENISKKLVENRPGNCMNNRLKSNSIATDSSDDVSVDEERINTCKIIATF